MTDVAETATELVADVADEVAEQATAIAEVSRQTSSRNIGLAFGGFIFGAAIGVAIGYVMAKRQLEAKSNQSADEMIDEMRQHYNEKMVALKASKNKAEVDDLGDLVRQKGYDQDKQPIGMTPPDDLDALTMSRNPLNATHDPVEISEEPVEESTPSPPQIRNVFKEAEVEDTWDYQKEKQRRSPIRPYIIHRDELTDATDYDGVTWTYYEGDDVLCNERDEVIPENHRELSIGEVNLEKFGHGSEDANLLYVRNDRLSMIYEIIRSPNSYAEEVHGFEPEIRHADRKRRPAFDDE